MPKSRLLISGQIGQLQGQEHVTTVGGGRDPKTLGMDRRLMVTSESSTLRVLTHFLLNSALMGCLTIDFGYLDFEVSGEQKARLPGINLQPPHP